MSANQKPPMTPEGAKASLAAAHEGMTDREIAEHATCLAMVVASSDVALGSQYSLLQSALTSNQRLTNLARDTAIILRQMASLQTSHRKAEARRVLHTLIKHTQAMLDAEPPQIDNVRPVFSEEVWPDIFTPKGTRNGG